MRQDHQQHFPAAATHCLSKSEKLHRRYAEEQQV
jgi:hypothetical protein